MSYDPKTIVLVGFGRYARLGNGEKKKHPLSISQIPLIDPDGFSYLDGYLSNLKIEGEASAEAEGTDRFLLSSGEQREYVRAVARAFSEFPVNVECEGVHGNCEKGNIAEKLMVPFDRVSNHPEKVRKKGPERVNLLYIPHSYFNCGYCAEIRKDEKDSKRAHPESGYLEMDISFSFPDVLTQMPERLNWLFNKEELFGKLRRIAYQLNDRNIDYVIDSAQVERSCRSEESKNTVIGRYIAQRIVSRLLRIPEDEMPRKDKDFKSEFLGWEWLNAKAEKPHTPKPIEDPNKARDLYASLHIPDKNERLEIMLRQMKDQKKRRPPKQHPGQYEMELTLPAPF